MFKAYYNKVANCIKAETIIKPTKHIIMIYIQATAVSQDRATLGSPNLLLEIFPLAKNRYKPKKKLINGINRRSDNQPVKFKSCKRLIVKIIRK
ncbi:hypothetical protein AOY20_05085 [Acinetobacter equi]|uniref:Uncharacterized protein n=1 Tax=Acinetobacter equi TaxID=1324350 RepID=A0A0N9W067_9GAMM|nr:hypothetical protein AOY20_05085 [Acinetobacter equi]